VPNWQVCNCGMVIETPPRVPILALQKICGPTKKVVGKRSTKNRIKRKSTILEESQKITLEYDLPKLIHLMKKRLRLVVNAKKGHNIRV